MGSFWRGWPLVGGFILRGIVGHRGYFRFGFLLMGIFNEESVFRFEYFGAWVFVGVFLGGAAVGGCFGGAGVGCRCCWWLDGLLLLLLLLVADAVGLVLQCWVW